MVGPCRRHRRLAGWRLELLSPAVGWRAFVQDENTQILFDGTTWQSASGGSGGSESVAKLGINATADTTNRLAIAAPASLFNHQGNGH